MQYVINKVKRIIAQIIRIGIMSGKRMSIDNSFNFKRPRIEQ